MLPYQIIDENIKRFDDKVSRIENETTIEWNFQSLLFCKCVTFSKPLNKFRFTIYYDTNTNLSENGKQMQGFLFLNATSLAKYLEFQGFVKTLESNTISKYELIIETNFGDYIFMILFGVTEETLSKNKSSIYYNPLIQPTQKIEFPEDMVEKWKRKTSHKKDILILNKIKYFDILSREMDSILNTRDRDNAKIQVMIEFYEYLIDIPGFVFKNEKFRLDTINKAKNFKVDFLSIDEDKKRRLNLALKIFIQTYE